MGDVGSLALGGALGTVAILIKQELLLPIVGGVFVIEGAVGDHPGRLVQARPASASSGWRRSITTSSSSAGQEPKVITRFLILAIIFALLSLTTLKLR